MCPVTLPARTETPTRLLHALQLTTFADSKMKNTLRVVALVVLGCSMSLGLGCSNTSTPNTTTTPTDTLTTFVGSQYFTPSDSVGTTCHIVGTYTNLLKDGSVGGSITASHQGIAYLGAHELRFGRSVNPAYSFDFRGSLSNAGRPSAYLGISDSAVIGLNTVDPVALTLLPKHIKLGQPYSPTAGIATAQCTITPVKHYLTFAGKDGTSYSDVIQLGLTYYDSVHTSTDTSYIDHYYNSGSITLYFAKGLGLVQCDVPGWERHEYRYRYGSYPYFLHQVDSGYGTRVN